MIPHTYPSTFASNGQQQMVVYFLTSVVGLQRWVDYIPVKLTQGGTENSYNNNGYINVAVLPSLSSQTQAWKEYIPVYQDDAATDAWAVNSIGYIPYNYARFGDASLMLDFINGGSLDPRVTFTRASNATRFNSSGVLETVASNGPRFDYDPVTLQPKGLLIEEQRTNSIRNNTMQGAVAGTPGTLPTNWSFLAGTTGISSQVIGVGVEAGINYVDVRYFGTATASSSFSQRFEASNVIAALTGQVWSNSVWLKTQAGSLSGITAINHQYVENTSAGSFVTSGAVAVNATTTFERTQTTRTLSGGATVAFLATGVSVLVTNGAAIDITLRIGMPQLELGAFATSVIPTTTAAATRAADVAVMTGANFSSWYNQTEGTLFAEWSSLGTQAARVFTVNDGTGNNTVSLVHTGTRYAGDVYVSNVFQGVLGPIASIAANEVEKHAIAYSLNNANVTSNGTNGTTDTAVLIPTVTQALIGAGRTNLSHSGHIRRIAYFPRRLANAELQAITS